MAALPPLTPRSQNDLIGTHSLLEFAAAAAAAAALVAVHGTRC